MKVAELEVATPVPEVSLADSVWVRLDDWMERASERLNPILVKEARQALKSRQFAWTFAAMLLCALFWSYFLLTYSADTRNADRVGMTAFAGYLVILCIPLLVIVPYSAFYSLSSERQDGTFELLAITSLNARQIVTGKLASAVLQMIVYFSALGPCIGFTYLLRGVDIATIVLALAYAFFFSLLFSSVGLFLGAVARQAGVQVGISVVFVGMLVVVTWIGLLITMDILFTGGGGATDTANYWLVHLAAVSFIVSFVVLFVKAASAAIDFPSANRSTALRYIMLGQQTLLIGWVTYLALNTLSDASLGIPLIIAAIYWGVMGAIMTGELGKMSPRARRGLPQSALGRITLTWFNPGSGTGYVFAIANLFAVVVVLSLLTAFLPISGAPENRVVLAGWLMLAYVALYLGLGRLIILWVRRKRFVGIYAALLLHSALAALGTLVPLAVQPLFTEPQGMVYSPAHATNFVWTLSELHTSSGADVASSLSLIWMGGAVVFLVNLFGAAREVAQVRLATPMRVLVDDTARLET